MTRQVNPVGRRADAGEERVDQLLPAPDEGEDRAVVIPVGVDVEQARRAREGFPKRRERPGIPALRHVRDRLER